MRIGIVETGRPSDTLAQKHGNYPEMFAKLIGAHLPGANFLTWSPVAAEPPVSPDTADGWVITGSRHGAYDDLVWIKHLETFVQTCVAHSIPLIGVCFGHQIIAQALGGKVHKSNKGWGVGPQNYHISNIPSWIDGLSEEYTSHAIHQDQVTQIPPNSTVIASSDFCKYAAMYYGDAEFPEAISVQSHPEFSAEFVRDIGAERLTRVVPPAVLNAGFEQLGKPVNNQEWGKIFATYFQRSKK